MYPYLMTFTSHIAVRKFFPISQYQKYIQSYIFLHSLATLFVLKMQIKKYMNITQISNLLMCNFISKKH